LPERPTQTQIERQAEAEIAFRDRLIQLKKDDPATYQFVHDFTNAHAYKNMVNMQGDIFALLPDLLRFVSATAYWKEGDGMIPVTEYICMYDATLSPEDAVAALKENPEILWKGAEDQAAVQQKPCVMIRHMDREHIQPCLMRVAAVFERIVRRDKPDETTLKADLAELRYRLSFIMRDERGSAAVSEWFESALAEIHNFTAKLPDGTKGDCEALSTPYMPNFVKKFVKLLNLAPLRAPIEKKV